jgi:hypothetical protein
MQKQTSTYKPKTLSPESLVSTFSAFSADSAIGKNQTMHSGRKNDRSLLYD